MSYLKRNTEIFHCSNWSIVSVLFIVILNGAPPDLRSQDAFEHRVLLLEEERGTRSEWLALAEVADKDWQPFIKAVANEKTTPYPENAHVFEGLFEEYSEGQNETAKVLSARHASALHTSHKNVEQGKPYCDYCIQHAEPLSISVFGHCLLNGAIERRVKGDFQSAHHYIDSALAVFQMHQRKRDLGFALFNKGSTFHFQSIPDSAMSYYLQAHKIFETYGDSALLGKLNNNMGTIAVLMKDYKRGREYYARSLAYRQSEDDSSILASSINSLGNLHLSLQDWDSAAYYFEQALALNASINNRQGMVWSLNNIANAAYYSGDYHKAHDYFLRSLDLAIEIKDSIEICRLNCNIGWSMISLGRVQEAKPYFDEGLNIALKVDSYESKEIAYEGLSDYYLEIEDFEQALAYYSQSRDMADQILNAQRMQQINEMHERYASEKKEKEIAKLNAEKANASLAISTQRNWIIGLVSGIIIVMILSWFLYMRKQQQAAIMLSKKELAFNKKLLHATLIAQEDERQRIAKEMHDGLVQTIAALKLGIQRTINQLNLRTDQKPSFKEHLAQLDEAAQEARELSHQMMPKALTEAGLITSLEDMFKKTLDKAGIQYSFEHFNIEDVRFEKPVEIGLYRIAQEMVNNIIKHSGAQYVTIQLYKTKFHLILHIEDDGTGFELDNPIEQSGIGLNNIFSRASAIKGEVNYEKGSLKGTAANVRIPLESALIS